MHNPTAKMLDRLCNFYLGSEAEWLSSGFIFRESLVQFQPLPPKTDKTGIL